MSARDSRKNVERATDARAATVRIASRAVLGSADMRGRAGRALDRSEA